MGIFRRQHRRVITNETKTIQHYFIFGKYHTVKPGQTIVVEKIEEVDDLSVFNVFVDNCDGVLTYVGYAEFGIKENEPYFAIKKYITDGGVEKWAFANCRFMSCCWDKRETYNYCM